MRSEFVDALFGGCLIGISVSIMLLFTGRVTGISGILGGLVRPLKGETLWRVCFVAGLLVAGYVGHLLVASPNFLSGNILHLPTMSIGDVARILIAGLLVGFGTIMGTGCTSGHGICGISRLSKRSIVATITFILAGVLTIIFLRISGL